MTIPRLMVLSQSYTQCPRLNIEGYNGRAYPFDWCNERGQYEYQPKNRDEVLDLCTAPKVNRNYLFMPVISYDSPDELMEWIRKCRDVGVEIRDTDTVEILQRLYAVAIKPPAEVEPSLPPVHPAAVVDSEEVEVVPPLNRRARRQSGWQKVQPALAESTG